jgi:hypothetical protein
MTAYCLLLDSPTIGWYSGIVVLDVERGGSVFLTSLCFNIMHVRTFVEECSTNAGMIQYDLSVLILFIFVIKAMK